MKIKTIKLHRAHRIAKITSDEFSAKRHPELTISFRDGWVFFSHAGSVTALGQNEVKRFTVDAEDFEIKRGRPAGSGKVLSG